MAAGRNLATSRFQTCVTYVGCTEDLFKSVLYNDHYRADLYILEMQHPKAFQSSLISKKLPCTVSWICHIGNSILSKTRFTLVWCSCHFCCLCQSGDEGSAVAAIHNTKRNLKLNKINRCSEKIRPLPSCVKTCLHLPYLQCLRWQGHSAVLLLKFFKCWKFDIQSST